MHRLSFDPTLAFFTYLACVALAIATAIVLVVLGRMAWESRRRPTGLPTDLIIVDDGRVIEFEFKTEPVPVNLAERQAAFYRSLTR